MDTLSEIRDCKHSILGNLKIVVIDTKPNRSHYLTLITKWRFFLLIFIKVMEMFIEIHGIIPCRLNENNIATTEVDKLL